MTSKILIDREILERATDNKYIDKERISIYRHEALCSIRALLAAKPKCWPCWSCHAPVTMANRADADGNCPHCEAELDLESWPFPDSAVPEAPRQDVIHQVRTHGSDCWEDITGESLEMCRCQPEEYEIRTLYAAPLSPDHSGGGAGMVIDERAEFENYYRDRIMGNRTGVRFLRSSSGAYLDREVVEMWSGWQARACLDKVKELNQ